MPNKERLAKENAAKTENAAKGTKEINYLFKPQLSNETMSNESIFIFSRTVSYLALFFSERIHILRTAASHAFAFP